MNWTSEKPAKSGYYWLRQVCSHFHPDLVWLSLEVDGDGEVIYQLTHDSDDLIDLVGTLWSPEIVPPKK